MMKNENKVIVLNSTTKKIDVKSLKGNTQKEYELIKLYLIDVISLIYINQDTFCS